MKKISIFLGLTILVVMISGCTSSTEDSVNTFNKSGISFTYPSSWSELSLDEIQNLSVSPDDAIGGVESDDLLMVMMVHRYPREGLTFTQLQSRIEDVFADENISNIKEVNINGIQALEATSSTSTIKKRLLTFISEEYVYLVEFAAAKEDFAAKESVINEIQKSIQL